MVSFSAKTYSKRLLPLISWGHWFTFFNIVLAILLSSFYLFTETFPETLLGQTYFITNWISHISFLVFMCFVLILFPLILIYPNTRFIRASSSVIYTFILLLLLLDGFVYRQLGYHLNASSTSQVIELITGLIEEESRIFWTISLLLCLVFLSIQFVVSNYAWKHLRQLQKTTFARKVIFGLVGAFSFSHIIHIWADANLEYDILRQDSFLPLTYPATAKTLLTKYGMFNRDDYIKRKTAPLSFSEEIPAYPLLDNMCEVSNEQISSFIVLTENRLSDHQINKIKQRSTASALVLEQHVDNSSGENAWFNLFYGLPTIYKDGVLSQNTEPVLFQAIKQQQLNTSLTVIGSNESELSPWFTNLFDQTNDLSDISSLISARKFDDLPAGLNVIYFTDHDGYQFELFMDALLLAQQNKSSADIIWVSSIGNLKKEQAFISKPAVLIHPSAKNKSLDVLTSQMDITPTLLSTWLNCPEKEINALNGENLLTGEWRRLFYRF